MLDTDYTLNTTSYRNNIEVKLIDVLYDSNNNPCTAVYAEIIMGKLKNERTAVINLNKSGYYFSYSGTKFYLKEFNWDNYEYRLSTDFINFILSGYIIQRHT